MHLLLGSTYCDDVESVDDELLEEVDLVAVL